MSLTRIEGVPAKEDLRAGIRGMAHFPGTGPFGTFCGNCKHYGYFRESRHGKSYRTTACWMFKKLTGKYGPRIKRDNNSCKYFDEKVKISKSSERVMDETCEIFKDALTNLAKK